MRELVHNGRYHIPLSAYEYVAMKMPESMHAENGVAYALIPPLDTTYPDAPHLVIALNGDIYSNEGKLAYTIDDLDYSGRTHDHSTNSASKS